VSGAKRGASRAKPDRSCASLLRFDLAYHRSNPNGRFALHVAIEHLDVEKVPTSANVGRAKPMVAARQKVFTFDSGAWRNSDDKADPKYQANPCCHVTAGALR
jgi:hypothetical protein